MRLCIVISFCLLLFTLSSFELNSNHLSVDDGKEIYFTYCKVCHGKKGSLGIGGAAKLTKSDMDLDSRIEIIINGKGKMTPFGAILSKKEIKAVAKFTMNFSNE